MIEIRNINKTYEKGKPNELHVLKDVTLTVTNGEMAAIIGKSGAGKSTLMHILGCIDDFDEGEYFLNGRDISRISEKQRAIIRNKEIGIVLQDFALMEKYSVIENILMPLYFTKNSGKKREWIQKALEVLKQMEMEQLADKRVNKLSGGQKQRVAIARAMINHPGILLADEPTGALDVNTSKEIMDIFQKLNMQGTTVIVITHDIEVADACSRVIEISDGKIVT